MSVVSDSAPEQQHTQGFLEGTEPPQPGLVQTHGYGKTLTTCSLRPGLGTPCVRECACVCVDWRTVHSGRYECVCVCVCMCVCVCVCVWGGLWCRGGVGGCACVCGVL